MFISAEYHGLSYFITEDLKNAVHTICISDIVDEDSIDFYTKLSIVQRFLEYATRIDVK